MKELLPVLTGLCLLLGACSGATDTTSGDDTALPGGSGPGGTGGQAATGGTSGIGAGPSGLAGTSAAAGFTAMGGTSSSFAGQGGTPGAAGSFDGGGTSSHGGSESGGTGSEQGGTSAMGGASTGGTSAVGGSGGSPTTGTDIDWSIWVLQLPTGSGNSPTTISSSGLKNGYSSAYFYQDADGGQDFMDPKTGITTIGSQHCRTEMRESTSGGGQAAWSSTGTNTMTVTGRVVKVGGGSSDTVTVGQLFNGTDSIPLVELQYSSGTGFKYFYEEAKGGGSGSSLNMPVKLGEKYSFTLALTKGVVTVTINGQVVKTQKPSSAVLGNEFYFKFGNYDQTATSGAITTTPYTIVEAYTVKVVHQ